MSDSPGTHAARRLVKELGIGTKKRWGQNFLVDPQVADRIVDVATLGTGDTVWEIGPGFGVLTERLLARADTVVAFEIDWGLVEYLRRRFAEESDLLTVVPGDATKTIPRTFVERGAPSHVVSNLPYRSAATILGRLVETRIAASRMVVTIQREVAQRILATPGGRDYCSLSVVLQSAYDIAPEFSLAPGVFYPAPEVDSTVLSLTRRDDAPVDPKALSALCRASFAARRKTLRNNLLTSAYVTSMGKDRLFEAVEDVGINLETRPERVTVAQYVALAARLSL